MSALPAAVRLALDARLATGDYGGFRALSRWLLEQFRCRISAAVLTYYVKYNFDQRLDDVKLATAQAIQIVHETGDNDDYMNRALTRLVQSTIFQMLLEISKARGLFRKAAAMPASSEAVAETNPKKQKKHKGKKGAGQASSTETKAPEADPMSSLPSKDRTRGANRGRAHGRGAGQGPIRVDPMARSRAGKSRRQSGGHQRETFGSGQGRRALARGREQNSRGADGDRRMRFA